MFEALKAAVEERKAQAEAAQAADLNGVYEVITSGAVTDEQARSVMEFWHANTSPAFVLRQCERDLKVLERHRPVAPIWPINEPRVCKYCASLCHADSDMDCDDPDAPWPCVEIRELAEVYQINLGVSE